MKISRLHEEFIEAARRPMSFGRLPVLPKGSDVPLIPMDRWVKTSETMTRTYSFMDGGQRNAFVKELLDHEEEVGHHAVITVEADKVTLLLQTEGIKRVSELDKEYAKWADELCKDILYSRRP